MKYKDPITGELRDVIIKSGDTLPIGTVVEFDGETIPDGYEEFETEDYGSLGNIIVDDVICKNLCSGISQGYFININGTSFGRTLADNGLVIKVEENNDYTISTTDTQASYRIAFTNTLLSIGGSSSDIYNALTKDGTKASITRNSGAYKYLIVNATDLSKIQVEKGSVATDYVEHKEFNNKQIYSTNEQVIGTWVDGKPLYRKVLNFGSLPNAGTKDISVGSTNINQVIDLRGFAFNSAGATMPLPYPHNSNVTQNVTMSYSGGSNGVIYVATESDRSSFSAYVIVEYTKTTD